MKKHYGFIVFLIIVSSISFQLPFVSGQALDLIEWHPSVTTGAIFAWKVTQVDVSNESMEDFLSGLIIQMKITEEPPTNPERIYNSTEAPDWLNMYINGFKIDITMMGELGSAFTQLVVPIEYHFDNGTSFTLEEIERLSNPIENQNISYTVENGFVNTTIGNETMKFTTFTKIETGIVSNISIYMDEMGSFTLNYFAVAANVNDEGDSTTIDDEYTNFQDPAIMFRDMLLFYGTIFGVTALVIAFVFYKRRG